MPRRKKRLGLQSSISMLMLAPAIGSGHRDSVCLALGNVSAADTGPELGLT